MSFPYMYSNRNYIPLFIIFYVFILSSCICIYILLIFNYIIFCYFLKYYYYYFLCFLSFIYFVCLFFFKFIILFFLNRVRSPLYKMDADPDIKYNKPLSGTH